MRINLARALLCAMGALVLVGAFPAREPQPCVEPLPIRIGSVDPRFGIDADDLSAAIGQASDVWSTAAHRPLFRVSPDAELTINLIYDWRQKTTVKDRGLKKQIDTLVAAMATLDRELDRGKASTEAMRRAYERDLADYNAEVQAVNDAGGAAAGQYHDMELRGQELDAQRARLNAHVARVNALVDRHNDIKIQIDRLVSTINGDGLAGNEIRKGLYAPRNGHPTIEIYQFSDLADLALVLAHEMGHALGIRHNDNPHAIMSPLLQDASLVLKPQDRQGLRDACGV
jgi:hypothetical protein